VQLLVQYDSIKWQPNVVVTDKTEGIFTGNQPIRVVASTSDVIYIGKRKPITVTVYNDSNKKINELEVKLIANTTFFAELQGSNDYNHSHFGWRRYHGLDQQKQTDVVVETKLKGVGFPIEPGRSWSGEILLDIPENVYPSLPREVSPIINRDYHISVAAITEGNIFTKAESKVCLGVMVGKRHPNLEIQAPLKPIGDPYKIQLAQINDGSNFNQFIPPPLIQNDGTTAYGYMNDTSNLFNNAVVPEQWFDDKDAGDNWAKQITDRGYGYDPSAPILENNMDNNQMYDNSQLNNNQMNNNSMYNPNNQMNPQLPICMILQYKHLILRVN
jgi:hypothetical protein